MKPNGLVAAASMTSQTSRPIRSHSRASWLTRAMLTFRNTFSSSLASSAASGDESSTTWSLMRRSSAAARAVLCSVVPPTSRGIVLDALAGSPGLTRSGAKARSKSGPASSPVDSSTSRNAPTVVPGKVVDWRTTSWPACRCGAIVSAAPMTGRRSGSLVVVTGVGTHTKIASAASRPASSGTTDAQAVGERGGQPFVGDVVDRGVAASQVVDPGRVRVHAGDVEAGLRERDGEGQADVSEADDGDVAVGGVGHRSISMVR